ncbi:Ribosome recycling factor [Marinobacter sp. ELB17]|nr:Ribosome recycling factor [Marinobacter sp. ELB17]
MIKSRAEKRTVRLKEHKSIRRSTGVGLIEVLVSLLVLSVGILGIAGLQTRALQMNQSVLYQSRANVLAYDIMDRMRANQSQVDNYQIDFSDAVPSFSNCYSPSANCTAIQIADFDLGSWRADLAAVLPDGKGSIVKTGGAEPAFIVTLQFDNARVEAATKAGQDKIGSGTPIIKQVSFRTAF